MRRQHVVLPLCASFVVGGSALPAASAAPIAEPPALTALVPPDPSRYGHFGEEAAAVPDVDGDGVTDVLVSEYTATMLYSGATGHLLSRARGSGNSMAGVPDVDGDGRGDLVIGTLETVDGLSGAGRVYLRSGASGDVLRTWVAPVPEKNGNFGYGVAGLPDLDGDGRGDIAVGHPFEGDGNRAPGAVYVFSGATGAELGVLHAPAQDQSLGVSLTPAGDLDRDGVDDLVASSWHGSTYVFSGATGRVLHRLEQPDSVDPHAGPFGIDTAVVPDLDGDGTQDIAVGSPGYQEGQTEGSAVTYSGATGDVLDIYLGSRRYSNFGSAVSGADLDGDGIGELLVSEDGTDGASTGAIYVFDGAGCRRIDGWSLTGFRANDLGTALENLGDLDGDGLDDLVVGASGVNRPPGLASSGAAWLVKSGSSSASAEPLQLLAEGLGGRVNPC